MSLRYRSFVAVVAALAFAVPLSGQQLSQGWESVAVPGTTSTDAGPVLLLPVPGPVPGPTSIFGPSFGLTVPIPPAQVVADPSQDPASSLLPPLAPQGSFAPVSEYDATAGMAPSSNVALMIVGGAALVVGSLVDGDSGTIIMVGGAVVGLIGLFRYLG